jgi:hypothetical protein
MSGVRTEMLDSGTPEGVSTGHVAVSSEPLCWQTPGALLATMVAGIREVRIVSTQMSPHGGS